MIAVVDYRKGNLKSVERGIAAAGGDAIVTDDARAIARARAIVLPGVGAFADASASMRALGQMEVIRERIAAGVPFLGICLGMHLLFEEGQEGAPQEDDEVSSHNAFGLAVLPGVVTKLSRRDEEGNSYKIPHVGWNTLVPAACQPPKQADAAASSRARSSRDDGGAPTEASSVGASSGARATSAVIRDSGMGEIRADLDGSRGFENRLLVGIEPGEYFYFTHSYGAPSGPFVVAETIHSEAFPSVVQYGDVAFGVQFHPEKSSDAGAALLRNFVDIVKGA